MKNFSENLLPLRLKEIRGARSQKEMAEMIGIPQQTYAGWEIGNRQPKLEKLIALSSQFEVSCDWLLGLTDDRKPTTRASVAARMEEERKAVESVLARTAAKAAPQEPQRERLKVLDSSFELSSTGELVNRIRVKRQDGTTRTIEIPQPISIPISKTSLHDHELVLVRKKSPRKKTAKVVVVPAKI